jgi:isoquinoline 1-oxidoreductase alpha subunit
VVLMNNINVKVNGKVEKVAVIDDATLLWTLRETLGLKGTKFGCGAGLCGACTVHVDGEPVRSCQTSAASVVGKSVTTIEGLAGSGQHPLQKAWVREQVPQCGYCQSGQIMRAAGLLSKTKSPSRKEIVEYMNTNLCRCGTYNKIISAITAAAEEM